MPAQRSETENTLEYEVRIAAAPETVFSYFTDPAKMVQWMGTEATLDPRPGGVCRINPAGHAVMSGEFLEVEPPRRIVFSWGWELEFFSTPPQATVVEVSLTPDRGETVLRLVHRRQSPEALPFHRHGWDHYLPRLARVAAGQDVEVDPWRDLAVTLEALRQSGISI